MRKVWVTGAQGLIGSHVVTALSRDRDLSVVPVTRQYVDLECEAAVEARFVLDRPDIVVHCAACSDTAACEADPAYAESVNITATARLARLAENQSFIFFSTDLVFDGKSAPYVESAAVRPLSVYAQTKVAAERVVLQNSRHTVLRTSMTAGTAPDGKGGFDQVLLRAWLEHRQLTLFTDEFRNPIAAEVTARAVHEVIIRELSGLYHLAGSERLSRFQIGELLAGYYPDVALQILPGSLRDFRDQTRPADCSLNCDKLQRKLSFQLPRFSDWLHDRKMRGE